MSPPADALRARREVAFDDHAPLPDGVHLIEASAGTGKTHSITSIVVRLIAEHGVPLREILVVTFTEAATSELRDRIRRRLVDARSTYDGEDRGDPLFRDLAADADPAARKAAVERIDQALASFDEAMISTIHGFCFRMLQEHAFESGATFDAELLQDTDPILHEIVDDYWSRRTHSAPPALVRLLRERKIGPTHLFTLARMVCNARDARVTWSFPTAPLDEDAWAHDVRALKDEHARSGAEALGLLVAARDAKRFNKGYVAADIEARFAALNAFLEDDAHPFGELPDGFRFFCWSTIEEYWNKRGTSKPPRLALFDLAERLLHQLTAAADQILVDMVGYARSEFARRKEAAFALAYDDLLLRLRDALRGPRGDTLSRAISERFDTALIDEFQDTDAIQYEIFREAFQRGGHRLFLIGDPKQAIYSFRGADLHAYLVAADDAAARDGVSTLAQNHRSDAPLVHALSALFSARARPFFEPRIAFTRPVEKHGQRWRHADGGSLPAALRVRFAEPEHAPAIERQKPDPSKGRGATVKGSWLNEHTPAMVATDIVAFLHEPLLIEEAPISPGHIAVLVRTNAQARSIQTQLRARQVPSVLHGDSSVFDSDESRELLFVLRAIAEPWNPRLMRAALATDLILGDGDALFLMQEGTSSTRNADDASYANAWDEYVERFRELKDVWQRRGFIQMFEVMLRDFKVASRRLSIVGGERTMTNLLHLGELLQRMSREERLGPNGLLRRFSRLRSGKDEYTEHEARQIRLESDREAVQLVTIHRSKGLQYPVVFLPYGWTGSSLWRDSQRFVRYHDRATDSICIHLYADPKSQTSASETPASEGSAAPVGPSPLLLAEQETFAEDIRLLYVALTRARHHVTVYHGAVGHPQTPSARSPLAWLTLPDSDSDATPSPRSAAQGTPADLGEALRRDQAALAAASPEALRGHLTALAGSSETSFEVLPMIEANDQIWIRPRPDAPDLAARIFPRRIDRAWRVSSFTQLLSGASDLSHGEDRLDPAIDPSELQPRLVHADAERLIDLPRGAATGNLLHAILENIDFAREARAALTAETQVRLEASGIDLRWRDPIAAGLGRVLDTPMQIDGPENPTHTLCLSDVPAARRLVELEFILPAAQGDPDARGPRGAMGALQPEGLARAFREHGSTSVCGAYLDFVTALRFEPLRGYLRGFIDLVFADEGGRYFVVDYKSNHLGTLPEDYGADRLRAAMAAHHYYLQYHLYCVALHRHLRSRLMGYDPAIHLGGVLYLFLRGMDHGAGEAAPTNGLGVFHDRPSPQLIEALDAAISPPGGVQ